MFVVLELDTYAGDGCEQTSSYTVQNVYGPWKSQEEAQSWVDKQEKSYSTDYEIQRVGEP
jgi:hypothetical protein